MLKNNLRSTLYYFKNKVRITIIKSCYIACGYVKIKLRKKKVVAFNLSFLPRKSAIKRGLLDVFETLIYQFLETFNMHLNIYSCLFHTANIKVEI